MNSEFLSRAEKIFKAATQLPSSDRQELINQECGSNAELRDLVQRLQANDAMGMGAFLEAPPYFKENLYAESPIEGKWVDRFQLIRRLGQGGMGQVFLAQQQEPKRQVALKILRSDLLDTTLTHRFKIEIEALGRLNHPGIAQIHHAGSTEDGHSYFAMEFVPGKPLTEFAQTHDLNLTERLQLVVQICQAVQYANEQGVIHRDLKPANILVMEKRDGSFQAKVLDFGVARLTGAMGSDASVYTLPGQLLGTLAYMSPEQAAGETRGLDPRVDVYQLGVILYELLTGQLPVAVDTESIPKTLHRIMEQEPPGLGSLDATLSGDLEIIVHKALAKEPPRRFASVGDLAADLQRFLDGKPIAAHPSTTFYRLGKMLKSRQNYALGFALGIILAGLVGWQLMGNKDPSFQGAPKLTQLTAMQDKRFPGYSLGFSPDGSTLAYVDGGKVWTRNMATEQTEIHEIPGFADKFAASVSWFPSGDDILVEFVIEKGKRELVRCSLGNADQQLIHRYSEYAHPIVSPDGEKVLLMMDQGQAFSILDLPTGKLTRILQSAEGESFGLPVWAPDSAHLAYCRKREPDIFLECVDRKGNTTQLLSDPSLWFMSRYTTSAWLPDGRLLFSRFQDKSNSATEIMALPMDVSAGKARGKPLRIHSLENRVIKEMTFSHTTNTLVFNANLREDQLVLIDLWDDPPLVPRNLRNRGWTSSPLAWSPDGQRLLMRETSSSHKDRGLIKDMDSGECFVADCFPDSAEAIGLSGDGRHVFFIHNLKILAIPWDCGPVVDLGYTVPIKPQWIEVQSPLAGYGNSLLLIKEGNEIQIREVSLTDGVGPELTPIIPETTGFDEQYWAWANLSHDGSQFVLCEYKPDIKIINRETGKTRRIPSGLDRVRQVRWSWDGNWIYCEGRVGQKNCLVRVDPKTEKSELLWSKDLGMLITPELSPDGSSMAVIHLKMGTDLFQLSGF